MLVLLELEVALEPLELGEHLALLGRQRLPLLLKLAPLLGQVVGELLPLARDARALLLEALALLRQQRVEVRLDLGRVRRLLNDAARLSGRKRRSLMWEAARTPGGRALGADVALAAAAGAWRWLRGR